MKQRTKSTSGNWSANVTRESFALELEEGVFTWKDPKRIVRSLKRSADPSTRQCQFLKLEELRELPAFSARRRPPLRSSARVIVPKSAMMPLNISQLLSSRHSRLLWNDK